MPSANTPIAFIHAILKAYKQYRKSPNDALVNAKISQTDLENPHARISALQMETFCYLSMRALDDEALGWFSRKLPWGSYGMLCRASLTSPNLEVAIRRWCRHHRLLTQDIELSLSINKNIATLEIRENLALDDYRELCLLTSFRYLLGYASWLINSRITLNLVRFPFHAPEDHEIYPKLFNCPVLFADAQTPIDHAQLIFSADYLALTHFRLERDLQKMLKQALYLTVHNYQKDKLLADRVREYLQAQLSQASESKTGMNLQGFSIPAIAKRFHLSARTLHRHLQEEGESWQHIKNTIRLEHAEHQLQHSRLAIKQIAFNSGWRNEKSFSRAFHQWKGASPQSFRQTH